MLTRTLRRASLVLVLGAAALGWACDNMPLVAPTGTVITLFANNTVLPVDGSIEIIAIAIESGSAPTTGTGTGGTGGTGTTTGASSTAAKGTPVHNGTVISFTTTLGRIEPQEARTHNGQVNVRLFANGQSGVATVRAFSGGAASNELIMNVGAAAAKTVFLSATPQTLSSAGGTAQINARVVDVNGTNLASVPVTFTADNGTLSNSTALTNGEGVATTSVTTSRETKVTATVATGVTADVTVRLNPRINLVITPPTTPPTAGVSANFTIAVGANANVQNVRVNWGDGSTQDLGAISGSVTVPHRYNSDGDFTIAVTAFDASGNTETVTSGVSVLPQQPPTVDLTVAPTAPRVGDLVTATARVSGNTTAILQYVFDFGEGPSSVLSGTSNVARYAYTSTGPKTITVTVQQASGPVGRAQFSLNVSAAIP